MNAFIKYLLEHLSELSGFSWFLIGLFSVGFGLGFFTLFRWLYKNRFEAQDDVLKLRFDLIDSYKSRLEQLEEERKEFQKELHRAQIAIKTLSVKQIEKRIREDALEKTGREIFRHLVAARFMAKWIDNLRFLLLWGVNLQSRFLIYDDLRLVTRDLNSTSTRVFRVKLEQALKPVV